MPLGFVQLLHHLPAWALVFFRLSGIFFLAPVFGSVSIPVRVKILLVFVLSLCIYPMLLEPPATAAGTGLQVQPALARSQGLLEPTILPPLSQSVAATSISAVLDRGLSLWHLLPLVACELLIGLIIGFGSNLPLVGMQISGKIIDQQLGFGLGGVYNPDLEEESGIVGQFFFTLALAVFLLLNGHRVLLGTLVDSFHAIPLGGFRADGRLMELMVALLGSMFELALRVSAPLLCLVFLETLAMGFIARTIPQMNILSIGFPVRIVVGLGLLSAMVVVKAEVFIQIMQSTLRDIATYLGH
ncbi:MAG: flagellar biosynthetic protein FliR [Phycisphaeraceae bacterium]|nr:flagellar biosynthetic protein FliR [Phycisphaeraceae bacterium]